MNQQFAFLGLIVGALLQVTQQSSKFHLGCFLQSVLTIGLIGLISQIFYIKAFSLAKPGTVSIIGCLNIIYAFTFEVLFLHEYPLPAQILGATLTVASIVLIILIKKV